METLMVCRLVLILVFALAAYRKLAERGGFLQTLGDFGVPAMWQRPLGAALPALELGAAFLLALPPTVVWGALLAALLLAVFSAVIVKNLLQGTRPACNCFGQTRAGPISGVTLARNLLLLAAAVYVSRYGAQGVDGRWSDPVMATLYAFSGAKLTALLFDLALLWQLWLIMHLFEQNGRLILRLDVVELHMRSAGLIELPAAQAAARGLKIGTPAPAFALNDLQGKTTTLGTALAAARPTLLIFSDVACGPCQTLMPSLERWHRDVGADLNFLMISRGSAEEHRQKLQGSFSLPVLIESDRRVADSYLATATPSAVLISAQGRVASDLMLGAEQIVSLIRSTCAPPGLSVAAAT